MIYVFPRFINLLSLWCPSEYLISIQSFSHYLLIKKWRNEHRTPLFSYSEVQEIGRTSIEVSRRIQELWGKLQVQKGKITVVT